MPPTSPSLRDRNRDGCEFEIEPASETAAATRVFNTLEDLVTYGDDLPPEIDKQCSDAIDSAAEDNESDVLFVGCALQEIETLLRENTDSVLEDTDDFTNWLDGWLENWDEYIREQCLGDEDEEDDEDAALAAEDEDDDLNRFLADLDDELDDEEALADFYAD